ncbi:MAG: aminomethyltransferase beta-barrel domain-containing protein [Phycisphaerales bacterium]
MTVGNAEDLDSVGCTAAEANWLVDPPACGAWFECRAQCRYNSGAVAARARVIEAVDAPSPSGRAGAFEVEFGSPVRAVAPGQAVVVYGRDDLAGARRGLDRKGPARASVSGTIDRTDP